MIDFGINTMGLRTLEDLILRLKRRAAALFSDSTTREQITKLYVTELWDNFKTQGRSVGGWAKLSPGYAAWKRQHYPGRPILVLTGRMRKAATTKEDAYFRKDHTSTEITLGLKMQKGAWHQKGTKRMPARPLFEMNKDFAGRAGEIMLRRLFA